MILQRLLLVLIVSIGLSGCATGQVVLHPIDKSDIARMTKTVAYTPEKDGYFVSDFYVSEVMGAKVEQAKKKS